MRNIKVHAVLFFNSFLDASGEAVRVHLFMKIMVAAGANGRKKGVFSGRKNGDSHLRKEKISKKHLTFLWKCAILYLSYMTGCFLFCLKIRP